MTLQFKKAERRQAKLKIAISGPSGSGKTYSALRLAKGIGGKTAVIDTENGSASLYADRFDFDTLEIEPPYTSQKYVAAIDAAEKAGYKVIVVDSFSHLWAGEGGTLDQKSARDARGGSGFANWKEPKQAYGQAKNAILHSTSHIIVTLRSKQAYLQVEDGGRTKIQKAGMDPIAEPGIEYEFTVVFDAQMDHKVQASKDRTALFVGEVFQVTEDTGAKLMAWLAGAKPQEAKPQEQPSGAFCAACGSELIETKQKGQGFFCPNWADKTTGNHTRVVAQKLEEYKAKQQGLRTNGGGDFSVAATQQAADSE